MMRVSLQCPDCYSIEVRRSTYRNKVEAALSPLLIFPFRCQRCCYRFWRATGKMQDFLDKLIAAFLSRPREYKYEAVPPQEEKAGPLS